MLRFSHASRPITGSQLNFVFVYLCRAVEDLAELKKSRAHVNSEIKEVEKFLSSAKGQLDFHQQEEFGTDLERAGEVDDDEDEYEEQERTITEAVWAEGGGLEALRAMTPMPEDEDDETREGSEFYLQDNIHCAQ